MRRTPCKYPGKNIAFHVNEGSTDYWLSLLVEFEDGDGDIGAMQIREVSIKREPLLANLITDRAFRSIFHCFNHNNNLRWKDGKAGSFTRWKLNPLEESLKKKKHALSHMIIKISHCLNTLTNKCIFLANQAALIWWLLTTFSFPLVVFVMITKMAGKFERVAGYEPCVGGKLVHYWWAFKRPILGEINNIIYGKKPLGQGHNPKELVSQGNLHFSP